MEVKGKIRLIGAYNRVSASFVKRELVVSSDEQYPQHILINFVQDKCNLLDNFRVGDFVVVGVNLKGREWVSPAGETKYFNDIQGWKVVEDTELTKNHPKPNTSEFDPPKAFSEEEDDLPF